MMYNNHMGFEKFRNLAVGIAATAASIGVSPKEANATNLDNVNSKTEIFHDINSAEKSEDAKESMDNRQINSFKELKNILKDYQPAVGQMSIKNIEDIFNNGISHGFRYYISTSVGQTSISASLTAQEQLKIGNHGIPVRKFTFNKDLSNKNVEVLILAEYK